MLDGTGCPEKPGCLNNGSVQGQAEWSFGQPDLEKGIPDQGRDVGIRFL